MKDCSERLFLLWVYMRIILGWCGLNEATPNCLLQSPLIASSGKAEFEMLEESEIVEGE